MPSTYSPDLRIELIADGEKSGTWGAITNQNLGTLIEDAISGSASVSITSSNQALTALDGAPDQARCSSLVLTTTTTANFNVYVPPVTKLYVIENASASYTATVYCSTDLGNTTAAGTGVAIPPLKKVLVRSTGVNVVEQLNHIVGGLTVGGAASFGGTVTLSGNPSSNLQAATKQYVDSMVVGGIPAGVILLWNFTIATIPSGWVLCDGTNGTPNLRNRFIIGASVDSGGSPTTTVTGSSTILGGVKDAVVVDHTHTVNDAGHTHTYGPSNRTSTAGSTGLLWSGTGTAGTTNTGLALTGISINNAGISGTNMNLPPYYALAYIMKT